MVRTSRPRRRRIAVANMQREYSKVIDDAKLDFLNLDQDATIRTTSCGTRGASLHLVGVTHVDHLPDFFMAPEGLFSRDGEDAEIWKVFLLTCVADTLREKPWESTGKR